MSPDKQPKASQQTAKPAVATKAPRLTLERVFDATPERLWTFWTDPKKYARWLSPQKADLVIHEWDLRVGGKVRFDMPLDNGQVNKEEGVFHLLDKPHKLVSGNADKTFLIDVTFTPLDGGKRTKLVVLIDGVPSDWHAPAREGWGVGFGKLDRLLAGDTAPAIKGITAPAKGHVTADRYVELERWYKATPARLFNAWSTPEMLERIFWPVGLGKVQFFDFRVGGALKMAHATQPWTAHWEYLEIAKDKKLVIRDIWPDGSGTTATGTMTFTPEGSGTRLKVRFGPFPKTGPYQPEGAVAGFAMGMDKTAEVIEVPAEGEGFRIIRYFNAPTAKVWEMWTTKEGLAKWWKLAAKDMGYAFKVNTLDVRVGGAYDIVMSNREHGELHNHGTYTEVVPNRRLGQRWHFDIFLAPGEKPYPISITIELEECPTMDPSVMGTKMTFTQGPMAKADFTEGSRQGVIGNFAKLEKALSA